jgi:hypothetical protein
MLQKLMLLKEVLTRSSDPTTQAFLYLCQAGLQQFLSVRRKEQLSSSKARRPSVHRTFTTGIITQCE